MMIGISGATASTTSMKMSASCMNTLANVPAMNWAIVLKSGDNFEMIGTRISSALTSTFAKTLAIMETIGARSSSAFPSSPTISSMTGANASSTGPNAAASTSIAVTNTSAINSMIGAMIGISLPKMANNGCSPSIKATMEGSRALNASPSNSPSRTSAGVIASMTSRITGVTSSRAPIKL